VDGTAHPPRGTGEGQRHAADPAPARGRERADQTSEDKDIGQELIECNRRLASCARKSRNSSSQSADDHVYWVERGGKAQRNLALNAAPVDVAEFLRRRLFESDTSVIMTSATLATFGQSASPSGGSPNHATRIKNAGKLRATRD
jgi:Rad3-related DNA helicase